MTLPYTIESSGNFDPSTQQDEIRGTVVTFALGPNARWTTVYVLSGSPLALDPNLFGSSPVSVARGGTIQGTAVLNTLYTLSIYETGISLEQTGVRNGTIKVGGG